MPLHPYRDCSKLRTRTALGAYSRAMPRSRGPPSGQCVSLFASNPCRTWIPTVHVGEFSGDLNSSKFHNRSRERSQKDRPLPSVWRGWTCSWTNPHLSTGFPSPLNVMYPEALTRDPPACFCKQSVSATVVYLCTERPLFLLPPHCHPLLRTRKQPSRERGGAARAERALRLR